MKTQAQLQKNLAALMITSALFFTGCQKDDLASIQSEDAANRSEVSRKGSETVAFTMVTINHQAAQTNGRSYKIEIRNDGTVLFTGRKNTAFIGEKKFKVSPGITVNLLKMFGESNFQEIELLPYTPDLALIETSFQPDQNSEAITRIDYNNGKLMKLVELREQTEAMLDINNLIYTKRDINSLKVNMAQQYN